MEGRSERLARNEALFREINERIEEVSRGVASGDSLEVLCECGRRECLQAIDISRAEYEVVRAAPDRFVVASGHAQAEIEHVVTSTDRFEVVEKVGDAGAIAEAADPRSH